MMDIYNKYEEDSQKSASVVKVITSLFDKGYK